MTEDGLIELAKEAGAKVVVAGKQKVTYILGKDGYFFTDEKLTKFASIIEAKQASSEPVREAIQTIKSNSLQGGDTQLYTHPAPSKDAERIKELEALIAELERIPPMKVRVAKDSLERVEVYPASEIRTLLAKIKDK